jgi:hypothetical protein
MGYRQGKYQIIYIQLNTKGAASNLAFKTAPLTN